MQWPNHNAKSARHQPSRNSILKANIKASNKMKMKRVFMGNRKRNGSQVQTSKYAQPMSKTFSQNSQLDDQHFWLHNFFNQVRFLLKHIASNPILFDENHIECFNEMAKISAWKEIAHDFKGLSLQSE